MNISILDQVLSSQKNSAISSFEPETIAQKLFVVLNDRERDIIFKRHGLDGTQKITLEEIGNRYSVTRERIRQVENASLKRIKESYKESILKEFEQLLRSILDDHSGIMSESNIINALLEEKRTSDANRAFIRFILNQLMYDHFILSRESNNIYKSWSTPTASWEQFHATIQQLVSIIEEHAEPLELQLLIDKSRDSIQLDESLQPRRDIIIMNFLDITKHIEENKFNEWGLAHWNSIRPRRMNDKIYLIMKREGKPLHFTKIAERINQAQFDKRIAYPATIHNELILDNKYVLVGRGMYALREWGYKPGVVLDVIMEILKDNNAPMSRDEIIDEVLKNRMVKRSTIILALMNKNYFTKDLNGKYTLVKT